MEHLDGVTFFAHNKGISDDDSIETIKMWVAAMYYFNLEYDLPCDDLNAYFLWRIKECGSTKFRNKRSFYSKTQMVLL